MEYFTKLFDSRGATKILRVVVPKVSVEMNQELFRLVSNDEIKFSLFQMHPIRAPRLDVCDGVRFILSSGRMLRKINYTHVTLIPKKLDPTSMTQLHPISLCNVIYKICSKVLTNRLKVILPDIVSPSQSAFIPGRLISDNCLVASEIAHYMHRKNNGWNGVMALKLDISKAYDPKGLVQPKRGIRQGDPFLFNPVDTMIWTKEPMGVFTTKSAYFVARTCHCIGGDEPMGSMINEDTKFLWKALWQATAPRKVKICVWRGCMDALPSKVNLTKRRVLMKDVCGLCDKEVETIEHALFGFEDGLCGWLAHMAQLLSKDSFELLLVLLWSIWKIGLHGGIGIVVRNSEGEFIAAMVVWENGIRSVLHAEAVVARATAVFTRQWSTEQVQGEGDALMVISAIQNEGTAHQGPYGHLFADTRQILQSFKQWNVSFGRRDTNKVAHHLARFSLALDHPASWFEEPPDVIFDVLLEDSISS
ncbi:hypothetical protein D8674_019300 [Pyrus ussuriensis x Pyrus communis]|uniref:Reverse transcriptase domain-containing protein n=1 Tax=Pyrus ussuriensis x Pyrus communis TaxID=2448454 RepID=A0A5N5G7M7_9ROSA|nr:hypothetical protein D8674_019300 [Pyrus ussuriensis x Pyrus communis]